MSEYFDQHTEILAAGDVHRCEYCREPATYHYNNGGRNAIDHYVCTLHLEHLRQLILEQIARWR